VTSKMKLFIALALAAVATAIPLESGRKALLDRIVLYPHLIEIGHRGLHLNQKPYTRIVNGEEATPHEFPHAAFLFIDRSYYCTGSLINEEVVITAGHCTDGAGVADIILGAHDHTANEASQQEIFADDIITHPGWTPVNVDCDLGLLRFFGTPVTVNENVAPIPLSTVEPAVDELVTMAGWGKIDDNPFTGVHDTLMKTTDPVADDSEADDYYNGSLPDGSPFAIDLSSKICIHYDTSGTCNGDSGGPLMYNGELVGVTSFGSSAGCTSGAPDCFTSVAYFNDWITENSQA